MEGATVTRNERNMEPHYVPIDDPLVKTLLEVYEEHTGQKGYEQIIGGGTYGRLLNVVSHMGRCSQATQIRCTKQTNL